MGFHAVEALDDAIDETKDILMPFELVKWAKLAIILILAGVGSTMFGGATDVTSFQDLGSETGLDMAAILVLAGIGFSVSLLLLFIRSWFTFVVYKSLSVKDIQIVDFMRENFAKASRYFSFLFATSVLSLSMMLFVGTAAIYEILLIPAAIIVGLSLSALFVANILVRDLVVPRMMHTSLNFIPASKEVFNSVKVQKKQVLVYFLLRAFVSIVVSITISILVVMSALVILLLGSPFLIVSYLITPFLLILPIIILVMAWAVSIFFITVPFNAYLFNYALSFYSRTLDEDVYVKE